jgi:hypothetical protein
VRREKSKMIISFLAIAFFFISGWAIMFYSIVYRWCVESIPVCRRCLISFYRSFLQWPYLGCFTVASFILILSVLFL